MDVSAFVSCYIAAVTSDKVTELVVNAVVCPYVQEHCGCLSVKFSGLSYSSCFQTVVRRPNGVRE